MNITRCSKNVYFFRGRCLYDSFMMHMMTQVPERLEEESAYFFDPKKNPNLHVWKIIHMAASIFCGNAIPGIASTTMIESFVVLAILFTSSFFFNYLVAVICATTVLSNKDM